MPPDTSWREPFLRLVAQGQSFTRAIRALGGNTVRLYQHFSIDPAFHQRALELRRAAGTPLSGSPPDTTWHARAVALIREGKTVAAAQRMVGVAEATWYQHVRQFPGFSASLQRAREDLVNRVMMLRRAGLTIAQIEYVLQAGELKRMINRPIPGKPRTDWPVDIDDLLELLRLVAAGLTLRDACAAARVPPPTVRRWRRRYPEVDAAIVAAAADGRERKISPLPPIRCPGRYCGSKTGYDYGCRKDPCRAAVARQVARLRRSAKGARDD